MALSTVLLAMSAGSEARGASSRAAVVPTRGPVSSEESKQVTIEVRNGLRRYGYVLARQKEVRDAARHLSSGDRITTEQLSKTAAALNAGLIVVPSVTKEQGQAPTLEVAAYDANVKRLVGFSAPLSGQGSGRLDITEIGAAASSCVAAIFGAYPSDRSAPRATPIPLQGAIEPIGSQSAETARPVEEEAQADQPQLKKEAKKGIWDDEGHAGIFADLGFVLAWCKGDALCSDSATGFGGRLRIGYRIYSYVAISASGVVGSHNISTDVVNSEKAFLWTGVFGGLRYYPLSRLHFDPFVGIDLGWTWMFATLKNESDGSLPDIATLPDYGPDGEDLASYSRSTLKMNGFTLSPHVGANLFITRSVAIGALAEWVLPFWNEVCEDVIDVSGSKKACVPFEDADQLQTADARRLPEAPPWFFTVNIHLMFVF